MSKLRVFRRICASTASTASTFSRYTVEALLPRSRGTVEALFFPMVRRISLSKSAFFTLLSRGCRGSFPNFAQEIDDLREGDDISPSKGDIPWSVGENEEAAIYGYDEYDEEDYGRILVDDREPIYHAPYGYDEYNEEDYYMWAYHDQMEAESPSWEQRAVDEIIDDERPGDYPANLPGDIGDIPF